MIDIDGKIYFDILNPCPSSAIFTQKNEFRIKVDNAKNDNPQKALSPFLTDFCIGYLRGLTYRLFKDEANDALNIIREALIKRKQSQNSAFLTISRLQIGLFTILLEREYLAIRIHDESSRMEVYIEKAIKNAFDRAENIEIGLRQILQNAIQHTPNKSCMFTFSVQQDKDIGNYSLCIIAADLNEAPHGGPPIIWSFLQNLKEEQQELEEISDSNAIGYDELKNVREKIQLSDFFGVLTEHSPKEEWFNFRRSNTSAHIGLSLFNNTMERCGAEFFVKSSFSYYTRRNIWNNQQAPIKIPLNWAMPGTQFSINIPIVMPKYAEPFDNLAQLGNGQSFSEGYEVFAKFLDYVCENVEFEESFSQFIEQANQYTFTNPSEKRKLHTCIWRHFWLKTLLGQGETRPRKFEKKLWSLNFSSLCDNDYLAKHDNCEVVTKGLYDALDFIRSEDEKLLSAGIETKSIEKYFQFINVSYAFLKVFKEVSVSLSIKLLPQNVQFFLLSAINKNGDDEIKHRSQIAMVGKTVGLAIQNSYILSLEHTIKGFEGRDIFDASRLMQPYSEQIMKNISQPPIQVMPVSWISNDWTSDVNNEFFRRLEAYADRPIFDGGYKFEHSHTRLGNKIHIRSFFEMSFLFYRTALANNAAFLFLRRLLQEPSTKNIACAGDMLFYGYASYSQAITIAITEILKHYRNDNGYCSDNVEYAIYQYNLQSESNPEDIAVYFSNPQTTSEAVRKESLNVIQIVPISTTMTTFGKMYEKLINDVKAQFGTTCEELSVLSNYTVFWVRDIEIHSNFSEIQKIYFGDSKETYEKATIAHVVHTEPIAMLPDTNTDVFYIISGFGAWQLPIDCEDCYPNDEDLTQEIPLIETDATSTIPTQQIPSRANANTYIEQIYDVIDNIEVERFSLLQDCVYYGHFRRGKNHFQYYIDTQKYFSKAKKLIENWLNKQGEIYRMNVAKQSITHPLPFLKIIFSPEHNTNVGFSQYVNTYFFGGTAEIISINEDKEFRSNFGYEYAAIKNAIRNLYNEFILEYGKDRALEYRPVKFFFVDDNIISGETYHKASSLLQMLIPQEYVVAYGTNVFDKCFFLIDRLSHSSKMAYTTNPDQDFLSFLHIDVSNMRHQGDSCVGCKLKYDAINLFKRSTTRSFAHYWAKKAADYEELHFDKSSEMKQYGGVDAYARFLLSHILKKRVIIDTPFADSRDRSKSVYLHLLDFVEYINGMSITTDYQVAGKTALQLVAQEYAYKNPTKNVPWIRLKILSTTIKLIARPFFSFDQTVKLAITWFVIALCESFFNRDICEISPIPKKAKSIEIFKNIIDLVRSLDEESDYNVVYFVQSCLFEALGDLRSTYLLRKKTLLSAIEFCKEKRMFPMDECPLRSEASCFQQCRSRFEKEACRRTQIACFWWHYGVNIQKAIECSDDESRALWIEKLLASGNEYVKGENEFNQTRAVGENPLFNSLVEESNLGKNDKLYVAVRTFCNELFLQNARLYYDGIEEIYKKSIKKNNAIDVSHREQEPALIQSSGYYLQSWRRIRSLNGLPMDDSENNEVGSEVELFKILEGGRENTRLESFYIKLCDHVRNTIQKVYHVNDVCVSLATFNGDPKTLPTQFGKPQKLRSSLYSQFDIIQYSNADESDKATAKTIIKERIIQSIYGNNTIEKGEKFDQLIECGYSVSFENTVCSKDISHRVPYVILSFDNPEINKLDESFPTLKKEAKSGLEKIVPVFYI